MWALAECLFAAPAHAVVLCLDECDVHLLPVLRAMWMHRGQQVQVMTPGKNRKRGIFGALALAGPNPGAWHYSITERKRTVDFLTFLEKLLQAYPTEPLYLVLDNASIQRPSSIERAATSHDYLGAISKLVTGLNDGHAVDPGTRLLTLFGSAFPPLAVRVIEGRLVVTENVDSSAAPGVRRGDILISVDGEDAKSHFARVRQYIPASTPASRDAIASQFFLAGQEGAVAALVTETANGRRDTADVPRRQKYVGPVFGFGRASALRLLPGNVGYVDLSVLSQPGVDSMFERFGNTRALILDLRGYPRRTHFLIASRLARSETVAARIRTCIVSAPDQNVPRAVVNGLAVSAGSYVEETQLTIPDARPPYSGRVYVLPDERSISQSEQAALFYRIAGHAILVGSNTAGADGDITMLTVPGGVGVAFTGADVRAPDGTPIQGVALTPDVHVEPTIAGIRAGCDELLECALRLATGKTRTCNPSTTSKAPSAATSTPTRSRRGGTIPIIGCFPKARRDGE